ncbi:MAG TPA: amidohydrolase family protein [Planctomycetota bacterium]|nr:amidohydrolase family protein [Planctomycetota bacterium]
MSGFVDAHAHLGAHGDFLMPRGGADDLVRRMDALGVERTALSANAAFCSDFRLGNDQAAAAAAAHPGRIFFYAVANPHYPDGMAPELERCAGLPGFVGVKLHSTTHNVALDSSLYDPAWSWARERGCPVLVHFWAAHGLCGSGNVRKAAARWPGVKLVLAHLGGFGEAWRELLPLAAEHPRLWFDTCGSRHARGAIEGLVAGGRAGRLLYGSDAPWIDPGSQIGKVLYADIPEGARAAILGGNARRLFGWEEAKD